jgi:hypothetical protein
MCRQGARRRLSVDFSTCDGTAPSCCVLLWPVIYYTRHIMLSEFQVSPTQTEGKGKGKKDSGSCRAKRLDVFFFFLKQAKPIAARPSAL